MSGLLGWCRRNRGGLVDTVEGKMMERPTIQEWAHEDRRIEQVEQDATLRLMEHRWRALHVYGFTLRQCAEATGRGKSTIASYARAWELRLSGVLVTRTSDLVEMANHDEEGQAAMQAVADRHGVSLQTVRKTRMPEVRRIQAAMADEPTIEAKREKAQRYVETAKQADKARATEAERRRANTGRTLLQLETELDKTRRALRSAVMLARDAEVLDDTWQETINGMLAECDHLLRLLNAALTGASGVDWDAEMASLVGEA